MTSPLPPCDFANELKRIQQSLNHTAADAAAVFTGISVRTWGRWVGVDQSDWPKECFRWPVVEFYRKHGRAKDAKSGRPLVVKSSPPAKRAGRGR